MSLDSNYTIKEINELCEINSSNYSKKDNWDFINYLDTKNIIKGEINEIKLFDPNYDKVPSRAKRKVKIDDIIISTVRPNQEHYGMIKNKIDNFLVSTGFTTLTVDKTQAYPEFIYYYITQKYITESLQTIAEQSTTSYPSIKPSDIGNLLIELPPLEIQEKISKILTSIENKITVNKEINKNLYLKIGLLILIF
ncbi:restriction endonuclease subunit S [uncultured Methanobrevibacter sp.]|uniref:restriction endonuclease subunit S n=1 Tax=uncultured Methanobrevibacter sp. TaxID=253161 RepID=UPI0025FC487A|nr:restriction endonuclease subunit S [uncultured Methanobrevibacter sp.]